MVQVYGASEEPHWEKLFSYVRVLDCLAWVASKAVLAERAYVVLFFAVLLTNQFAFVGGDRVVVYW